MKKAPRKNVPTFDHSELGLGSAELRAIRKCEAEIMLLGRRTTEETFDLGDQLNIAAALIPDRMFGKWAISVSRYSRQHLFSLMKIATVLKDHKTRLVEARMSATAMGHLASSPEHVDEVLAELEAGRSQRQNRSRQMSVAIMKKLTSLTKPRRRRRSKSQRTGEVEARYF
ncbi:hypothetical protein [Mesorhizobium sp. M0870]|uniref:hypothetical protein n=1 Tax=Mesorhizobium sp. M0870 TaxID=2957016 RepID=UPI00333565B3